jgi:integrase
MGSLYRNGKSYVFSYYENGKQKYKYLDITNTISDTRKKQLKRQLESRYETKSLNKKFSQKLDTIRDEYIDLKTKEVQRQLRSQNTLNGDKQHLRVFCEYVRDKHGRLNIDEVSSKVIESFKNYRFDVDNCNQTTVGNNLRGLQGFFKYCIEQSHLDLSPLVQVKIPQPLKRSSDKIPDKFEFHKIEKYLKDYVVSYLNDKDEFNWIKLISYLQIRTGMRNGEVLLMKWKQNKKTDIGEKHSFSYVYLNPSKTKLTIHFKRNLRLIPIKNDIRDLLIKIQKDTKSKEYVFENSETNSHFDNTSFSRPFKRLLKEINIDNINYTSHTLRHGKITDLLRNDVSISKIGKLVGHKTSRITEDYSHLISSDIEDLLY